MERMVSLDNKVQEAYTNYRPEVDGQVMTMSDIYTAMTTETDLAKREKVWRASKEVGNLIFDDLIELVKLRNQAARLAGYDNYHTMSVACSEQDVTQIDEILTQLIELTEQPFIDMKRLLDEVLARQYGIAIEALRPWHYHDPFFQRTPLVYELDLDTVYQDSDIEALMKRYYASVGLPINDILDRSDLYEREGKYPTPSVLRQTARGMSGSCVICRIPNVGPRRPCMNWGTRSTANTTIAPSPGSCENRPMRLPPRPWPCFLVD